MDHTDGDTHREQSPLGVFDRAAALKRLGDDLSLFDEMVDFFLNDSPGLLHQLREGLSQRDAKLVERAAHSLKGMASMFDAIRTVGAAARVEELGRSNRLDEAAAPVEQLSREVENLRQAMAAGRAS